VQVQHLVGHPNSGQIVAVDVERAFQSMIKLDGSKVRISAPTHATGIAALQLTLAVNGRDW
jgi:hypothetical protein